MRERLIEMIQSATGGCAKYWAEVIADKLIAEGVIVPTAKTEAQDMTISELRKSLEKTNHDVERYSRKIKELTAENKLLNVELENANYEILRLIEREKELTEENERLINASVNTVECAIDKIKEAKAKTVRKMQEFLKSSLKRDYITETVIDQIIKEMLEGL